MSPFERTEATLRRLPNGGVLRLVDSGGRQRRSDSLHEKMGLAFKIVFVALLFVPCALGALALADYASSALGMDGLARHSPMRDFINNLLALDLR